MWGISPDIYKYLGEPSSLINVVGDWSLSLRAAAQIA